MNPPVIGIVGGIGSGKSVVAAELLRHGGVLVSGDQLGHAALRQPDVKAQLVARWGKQVLDQAGEIDRRRVAAIVFANPDERKTLEAISHPVIERGIREMIQNARSMPAVRLIVLDAAVMLEAGWHGVCDYLVYVDSPRELRLARLQRDRGWTAQELEKRENSQMPLTEKRRHADAVVENTAGIEEVRAQVRRLLAQWGLAC
jgi:dephospho-CoA kinase